jgi:hypothetical protein
MCSLHDINKRFDIILHLPVTIFFVGSRPGDGFKELQYREEKNYFDEGCPSPFYSDMFEDILTHFKWKKLETEADSDTLCLWTNRQEKSALFYNNETVFMYYYDDQEKMVQHLAKLEQEITAKPVCERYFANHDELEMLAALESNRYQMYG